MPIQSPIASEMFEAPAFDPNDLNSVVDFLRSDDAPLPARPVARAPKKSPRDRVEVTAREGIARDRVRSALRRQP